MTTYYQPNKEEVKEARLFAKLTQQECADLCLVTSNTWARYEQGTTIMPAPIWKLFEYALAYRTASITEKPRRLTVYEQRRLENQKAEDSEAEAMRRLREEWAEEPSHDSKNDTEEALVQKQILNQFRVQKEIMITKIEEVSPKNGAEARRQFPDYDNIQIPMVQEHIKRLTPMYNSVKDS